MFWGRVVELKSVLYVVVERVISMYPIPESPARYKFSKNLIKTAKFLESSYVKID
jgi:hypothetical protein